VSEPSRPSPDDDEHSFWADRDPEPEPTRAGWMHSRVFGLGVVTMVGTVLGLAGLTWAGSSATSERLSAAKIAAAKAAPAGGCTFTVDDRSAPLEVVRARSLTMIAAVGRQVAAPDVQIARAIDVATSAPGTGPTKVVDALALLARDDATAPSRSGLAQLHALGVPATLTCRYVPTRLPVEQKGALGLTKRADTVRKYVLDAFGALPTSGYTRQAAKPAARSKPAKSAKAPAAAPAVDPAAEGRVVDVQVAPRTGAQASADETRTRGWQLAQWLVARGEVLKLDAVAYDDHTWSAASAAGWQVVAPEALTHNLDRVHITVQQGG
jgi:hypothetical protein